MMRDIYNAPYVPTLCVRPAEMRALEELPESDKDSLFPYILLAPWVGSKTLFRSIDRIHKSYSSRPYFLGLDRYYRSDGQGDAQSEFFGLFDPAAGRKNYFDFILRTDQAIPVVDPGAGDLDCFKRQLDRANRIGRGFLVIFDKFNSPVNSQIFDVLGQEEREDFAFHLDRGWLKEPLTEYLWYEGLCRSIFEIRERAAVVICGENFPKDFTIFNGIESIEIGERLLFRAVSQRFNNARLVYGDWASAKPRSYEIASTPLPRIDYPTQISWIIARNKDDAWDYTAAASELRTSDYWDDDLKIWGTYMIASTADSLPFSISSPQVSSSVRINIHLHLQTHFGKDASTISTDDPWID